MSALSRIIDIARDVGRGIGALVQIGRDLVRRPAPQRVEDLHVGAMTEAAIEQEREHARAKWGEP